MNDKAIKIQQQLNEMYKHVPIMFIKISSDIERLKQIQSGSLFMNNFQYFIDLEEKHGKVGMGDRAEASLVMYDADISISHLESDEPIAKVPVDAVFIRDNIAVQRPLFCLFVITIDMFEIVEIKEDKVTCRLKKSTQKKIANMKADFGEHVLIIDGILFVNKLEKSFKEKNYKYGYGFAQYVDHSVLDAKRFKHHKERNDRMFFYKDKKFEHQKEYRFVILNKQITEGAPEKIDSLESFSTIKNISFFEDGNSIELKDLKISFKK